MCDRASSLLSRARWLRPPNISTLAEKTQCACAAGRECETNPASHLHLCCCPQDPGVWLFKDAEVIGRRRRRWFALHRGSREFAYYDMAFIPPRTARKKVSVCACVCVCVHVCVCVCVSSESTFEHVPLLLCARARSRRPRLTEQQTPLLLLLLFTCSCLGHSGCNRSQQHHRCFEQWELP
jgi:hypothetical protein